MIEIKTISGRKRKKAPEKIVIHAMSEFIYYEERDHYAPYFLNKIGLSCHYMITPAGDTIECADYKTRTTWHARGHNHDSIGIEVLLPGKNDYIQLLKRMKTEWVNPQQFDGLVTLISSLPALPLHRHSELDPDRKQDPGAGFPWQKLLEEFNQ